MTDILRIVEKYTDLDVTQKLSHPDLAQDIAFIQNSMKSQSDEEIDRATEFLKNLMSDIEQTIGDLQKELDGKPEAMAQIKKTMEACLAYSNTPRQKE